MLPFYIILFVTVLHCFPVTLGKNTTKSDEDIVESYRKFRWRNHETLNIGRRDQAFLMFETDFGLYFHVNVSNCFNNNSLFTRLDAPSAYSEVNVLRNFYISVNSKSGLGCYKPLLSSFHSKYHNATRCLGSRQFKVKKLRAVSHSGNFALVDGEAGLDFFDMNDEPPGRRVCTDTLIKTKDIAFEFNEVHTTSFARGKRNVVILYNRNAMKVFDLHGKLLKQINISKNFILEKISSNQLNLYQTINNRKRIVTTMLNTETFEPIQSYSVEHHGLEGNFKTILFSNRYAIAVFYNPPEHNVSFEVYTTELCPEAELGPNLRSNIVPEAFTCKLNSEQNILRYFLLDPVLMAVPEERPANSLMKDKCIPLARTLPLILGKDVLFVEILAKSAVIALIFILTVFLISSFHTVKGSKDSLLLNVLSNKQFLIKLKDD